MTFWTFFDELIPVIKRHVSLPFGVFGRDTTEALIQYGAASAVFTSDGTMVKIVVRVPDRTDAEFQVELSSAAAIRMGHQVGALLAGSAANKPVVLLFDSDVEAANRYASAFHDAGLSLFSASHLPPGRLIREPGFDALYRPLAGAERWNVRPIQDVIQLIQTSDADRAEGWPRYVLVGLALSPRNAIDVESGFRTWARALLAALKHAPNGDHFRVKVPTDLIRLSELTPSRAAAILAEAEREFRSGDGSVC
jgi:hypothetical protein